MVYDSIVIGGGQAGLATGYRLQQAGLRFLILEAGSEPVGSWPFYYDSLYLNSPARYSSLPGLPFPGHPDHYPCRDEVVAYLRTYATYFRLPIVTGARVDKVERIGQLFRLTTSSQAHYWAQSVVVATGFFNQPNLPNLPGQTQFRGQLLHAAAYRSPESFRGQRIVIVGGGNAAVQIGVELAQLARVTLATRQPIRYLPQQIWGRDIHFWLKLIYLERTQWWGNQTNPVYDTGKYRAAIAAGKPDRRPMFHSFTKDGVVWNDGPDESVDTIIFATGYQPNLASLAQLSIQNKAGRVLQRKGVSTRVQGLYFAGLPRQNNVASATLRGVGTDAEIVVEHLQRYLAAQRPKNGRAATRVMIMPLVYQWSARGSELLGLISLISFSFKEQLATQPLAAPRLLGEAFVRSFIVGSGFLGFGAAANLYPHN